LETFGMTIIEAFSTGTPVVAAKIGGAEQLVEHGVNGLHYTPGNAAELAEKVEQLLRDPQLAENLGIAARQAYLKRYTAEVNYQQLLAIYQEVIRSKKKPIPVLEAAEMP